MEFVISPYASVGLLSWNMSKADVEVVIGSVPTAARQNRSGNSVVLWNDLMLTCIFDKSTKVLVEVAFSQGPAVAIYNGINLVETPVSEVVERLYGFDQEALDGVGSIVFPGLGISLTGYLPEEPEIKAVTAFARGRWDKMIASMKPFRIPPQTS